MIDRAALVAALRKQLAGVESDLRALSDDLHNPWGQQLRTEYEQARSVGRTALTWSEWRDGEVAQAGVAWVLGAVFVRFCEDNGLLEHPFIAGAGARLAEATDAETHFYRDGPSRNTRDWLRAGFSELARHPATRGLVDPAHSPVWTAPLSADACADILRFWRAQEADGSLTLSLEDPDWDTRFLGDLYQDLSDFAKKKYALLQTPDFVEEFILDRTLTPALEQVPLAELRLIDPTCGSGHFLLGAFDRLLDAWLGEAPAMDTRERIQKVLKAVNGVDINPFAVAIARFRLTLAAFKAAGVTRLEGSPSFRPRVAVGDSLLASRPKQLEMDFGDDDPDSVLAAHRYAAEDVDEYPGILERGRYHVVVGNPPYITVKDKALNEAYRRAYPMCAGKYALTVPFMELFFQLAMRDGVPGWIGLISSNSFMKREFGKKVVEQLLAGRDPSNPVDLVDVIDTSGAYIPGHGTPTVILIARSRPPEGAKVQAVLGVRGEPGQPLDAAEGLVWREIVEHLDGLGAYDGSFVSVVQMPRQQLGMHPWSLAGGGAEETKAAIEASCSLTLADRSTRIGFFGIAGSDEAMCTVPLEVQRHKLEPDSFFPLIVGTEVRDFATDSHEVAWFPYDIAHKLRPLHYFPRAARRMWPLRPVLEKRSAFSGRDFASQGRRWYQWHQLPEDRGASTESITFAEVATHNHFVLDRGGKVFKQTAPVVKLPEGATEDEHLGLMGVLNSSVACFWLKQVCHKKGGSPESGGGEANQPWSWSYQFNGTKLQAFPLPADLPLAYARTLDALAQRLADNTPAAIYSSGVPSRQRLDEARVEYDSIRAHMITWQEELDWHCYALYRLIDEDLTTDNPPPLRLGQRAFEIALARKVAAGEDETAWFERHGSMPITAIPADWPDDYKQRVQKRLDLIESDRSIGLLERPEYKRRWASEAWQSMEKTALTNYVLDRLENADFWTANGSPQTLTVAQLADAVRHDEGVQAGLDLLYGANADRVTAISALMAEEAVPYLATYRYKPSGMTKRAEWESVWDLQRREDAGEKVDIPVPPKYAQADFRKPTYWKARGKLDVPKERFILYPGAERANDSTAVYGWAGWDHGEQAQALAGLLVDRQDNEGWDADRVNPLLAGLVELEPWLHQWYDEIDPEYGTSLAQDMTALLETRLSAAGLTRDDARAWRPAEAARRRRSNVAQG
jgi:hypothetical protein